ncbi:MAG: class II glutamine amidotransferase [Deltaproteobacteria bacterium]|nr:class II glutamine amidotransferase [Deltaproteobacteria bacterium]MBI4796540.1 class II glutamine amidotransferase [Deltaproteobacteria bacterium]
MCDLFALSASRSYTAATSLPLFAVRGRANVHGWGIGFFRNSMPVVEKSGEKVFTDGRLHGSFQRLARVVNSPIIVAHIRYKSSGAVDECHAHPFTLDFWGQSWIFAHNGKAPAIEPYSSRCEPRLEAKSDSARILEFLRDCFMEAEPRRPHTPFIQVLKEALGRLLHDYPGEYNFLLTNGKVLWAFTNHRQFLLLKGSQKLEEALLLTTIDEGLSPEDWKRIVARPGSGGKILLIAGGDLLCLENLDPDLSP